MSLLANYTVGPDEQPDALFASNFPALTRKIVVAMGAEHSRGEVLGKITASGEYVLSDGGAVDGSETPDVILLDDVDTTGAAQEAMALIVGHVRFAALTLGPNHTETSVRDALRPLGIHVA